MKGQDSIEPEPWPDPIPTPSTKFSIDDRVQVIYGPVNVRQSAGGTILGTQNTGSLGTVTNGPEYSSPNWFWYVSFDHRLEDDDISGWVAEVFLDEYVEDSSNSPEYSNTFVVGNTIRAIDYCNDSWYVWNGDGSVCTLREAPGFEHPYIQISTTPRPRNGVVKADSQMRNGVFKDGHYWWYVEFERFSAAWIPEGAITRNQAPVASFTISKTTLERNESIIMDATSSFDPDGDELSYYWSFDGGEFREYSMLSAPRTHKYWTSTGNKTVSLMVIDRYGLRSSVVTQNVSVTKEWYQIGDAKIPVNELSEQNLTEIISALGMKSWSPSNPMERDLLEYEKKYLAAILFKVVDDSIPEYIFLQRVVSRLGDLDMVENVMAQQPANWRESSQKFYAGVDDMLKETAMLSLGEVSKMGYNLSYLFPSTGELTSYLAGVAQQVGMVGSAISTISDYYQVGKGLGMGMTWVYQKVPTMKRWSEAEINNALRIYLGLRSGGASHDASITDDIVEYNLKWATKEERVDLEGLFERWGDEYAWCMVGESLALCREFYTAILKEELIEAVRQHQYEPLVKEIRLYSPAFLQIEDSQGRITGVVNDVVVEDVPSTYYDSEKHAVTIISPRDEYTYRVTGLSEGSYGISLMTLGNGMTTSVLVPKIMTRRGVVHEFMTLDDISEDIMSEEVIVMKIRQEDGSTELLLRIDESYSDTLPPITLPTLTGSLLTTDTYINVETLTLTAEDNEGGVGVESTEYSFDEETWIEYVTPFEVTEEGTHTIYYRSTDWFGNVEETKSVTFTIVKDSSAPVTTLEAKSTGETPWFNSSVSVTLSATDDTSGVASTEYSLDLGATWLPYTAPFVLYGEPEYTVWYRSTDIAGNTEEIKVVTLNTSLIINPGLVTAQAAPRRSSGGGTRVLPTPLPQVLGVATTGISVADEERMALQKQIIELLLQLIELLKLRQGM